MSRGWLFVVEIRTTAVSRVTLRGAVARLWRSAFASLRKPLKQGNPDLSTLVKWKLCEEVVYA